MHLHMSKRGPLINNRLAVSPFITIKAPFKILLIDATYIKNKLLEYCALENVAKSQIQKYLWWVISFVV